jgi:hypothetical protein
VDVDSFLRSKKSVFIFDLKKMESILSAIASPVSAAPKASKKGGAAGGGKYTVDPAEIGDLEGWLVAYAAGAINVWKSPDNSLQVLDPAQAVADFAAARDAPVKTIPHAMGYDFAVVLGSAATSEELRAAAEAKRNAHLTEREGYVSGQMAAREVAEDELLTAADQWSASATPTDRRAAAFAVARKTAALARADRLLREAQFPYRQLNVIEKKEDVQITHGLRMTAAKDRVVTLGAANAAANNY